MKVLKSMEVILPEANKKGAILVKVRLDGLLQDPDRPDQKIDFKKPCLNIIYKVSKHLQIGLTYRT
jgi:hypothetical protein